MSDTNTLDGMSITQLRELARRAETAAKKQEADQQEERDKYTVSAAVDVHGCGALICVAKDGTRWFTVSGGAWVIVTNRDTSFDQAYKALTALRVFPYAYGDYNTFRHAHRPTYSGVRK